MKNRAIKLLSYLMVICMLVTSVPMVAFAAPQAVTTADSAVEFVTDEQQAELQTDAPQIKNVIFLIPDGAGYGSYDFANDVKMAGGFDDTKFPYKTPVDDSEMTLRSYHAGSMVSLNVYNSMTDSAAAGTALSTGYKTVNNYLGLDRRKMPHANLTEAAQSVGKATGLVSTYEWPHATPASFAVHAVQRTAYGDFYRQIENKGLQVVLGAGYGSVESYGGNAQTAIDNGYTFVNNKTELAAVQPGDRIWGNIATTNFDFDINNTATTATLAEMTQAAITALSADEDGFFLMVEGSKVDTGGHSNNTAQMSSDYIAFDAAFKVAVDFAKGRTDTVVVAVPDHDTGGLYYDELVAAGNLATAVAETQLGTDSALVEWESGSHTTQNVPFWCYYPEGITGIEGAAEPGHDYYVDENGNKNPVRTENIIDNTDIAPWCASLMGVDLDVLTSELFVNVTDIGLYDSTTEKFTFNNGDKYAYKDQAVYYKDGVETEMFGQMIVIEGTVYVPAEIIDEEDWNYVTEDFDGVTGAGTESDPYVIDDAWDFMEFTNNVVAGDSYEGKYIIQGADIDLSNKSTYTGMGTATFKGNYDGRGYTLNVAISSTGSNAATVFGVNDGRIMNVGITGSLSAENAHAASFVYRNGYGTILNCYSLANVTTSGDGYSSGLIFQNYASINNCYFGGTAKTASTSCNSEGEFLNVYYVETAGSQINNGTGVSAEVAKTTLADTLNSKLDELISTYGLGEDALNKWTYIDGIDYPVLKVKTPEVTGITVTPTAATVKRGESTTLTPTVLGNYNPSQEVVWNVSPAAASDETKFYEDGFFKIGADETVSQFTVQVKAAFGGAYTATAVVTVDLASDPVVKEDGSRTHPYLIETEEDFIEFTDNVNGGNQYSNKYLKQTKDLDLDGYDNYIGRYGETYFTGIYDGNGHTINVNINVERDENKQIDDICLFGYISSARILNLGVTGSIKAPGYVSTFARNMSSASLIANCWSTVHVESTAKGFGTHPGNDASGFVRSPYGGAIVNTYFAGELISPGGTSHPLGGAGTDYKAVYYNCAYLGTNSYDDDEQAEITEEDLEAGLASKFNTGIAESAKVATNANTKGYVYSPAMFHEWIDEIGGPRHNPRDDASRFEKEFTGNKAYEDVVIGSEATLKADGNVITIESLTVKEDATLHLEQGTYVLGDVTGTVTASPNANVLVTGTNKPAGYVEINIGTATGTRCAEVCGYQYDIVENDDNIYGVITDKNLIVEIVDEGGAALAAEETTESSTTSYYYVDAENGTSTLLPTMEDYMTNYTGQSLRFADEKYNSAIRFKAQITNAAKNEETEYVIDEYGYIITLEEKLSNNDYSQLNFDFSTPTGTAYISGVAYNKAEGIDKVFEGNDEVDQFTAVFYNIPENAYGKRIVTKTYTKVTVNGEQFILYGEPMVTSLYAVADRLIKSGTVTEGSEEYTKIKEIIDTATDNGFGNDAGADTGDLWN